MIWLGSFKGVVSTYDHNITSDDRSKDLHMWMSSLSRFNNYETIPAEMITDIYEHFEFFWSSDRLSEIHHKNRYLEQIPKNMRRELVEYLFSDILRVFDHFFHTREFPGSSFYTNLAFTFLPQKYNAGEVILRQGEAVHHIYLVKEGYVSILWYFGHK